MLNLLVICIKSLTKHLQYQSVSVGGAEHMRKYWSNFIQDSCVLVSVLNDHAKNICYDTLIHLASYVRVDSPSFLWLGWKKNVVLKIVVKLYCDAGIVGIPAIQKVLELIYLLLHFYKCAFTCLCFEGKHFLFAPLGVCGWLNRLREAFVFSFWWDSQTSRWRQAQKRARFSGRCQTGTISHFMNENFS